jgi:cyclic pyranopterin phosphate synthase
MLDRYKRNISYLRVSVTDRCNLRCTYCMPAEGVELMKKEEILSIEEIAAVIKVGAEKLGIKKIRLTGGEPLVRKGIVELVSLINAIPDIEEIALTTNGILLEQFAVELKNAGLNRVNISLDTVSKAEFAEVTRGGNIDDVFKGIQAAKKAGLEPVKINAVKNQHVSKEDVDALKEYCLQNALNLRFINQMDLEEGTFSQVEGGSSGNCSTCNRLRLMANGNIKPCLFNNEAYNIKEHGIEQAFLMALNMKPEKGIMNNNHHFYNIGG